MLGGAHQVIVYTVGAGHTLLRLSVATDGDGHGDHTGPRADSGAWAQVSALGAGRRWNGVLTREKFHTRLTVERGYPLPDWVLSQERKSRPPNSPDVRHSAMYSK